MSLLRDSEAAIQARISDALLEPFDRRTTRLVEIDGRLMQWVPDRDVYRIALSTSYWDRGRFLFTIEELRGHELRLTSEGAYMQLISEKLRRLQMRHYFLLAYERGGYC